MPTMIALVNLKEGVITEEYERWILESYAPAAKKLPSVKGWRNHRVSGLLGSLTTPPYRYVVAVEISDLEQLGKDMASAQMQELLLELHRLADVTQLMSERFA